MGSMNVFDSDSSAGMVDAQYTDEAYRLVKRVHDSIPTFSNYLLNLPALEQAYNYQASKAAGEGATVAGELFSYPSGDGRIIYAERTADGAGDAGGNSIVRGEAITKTLFDVTDAKNAEALGKTFTEITGNFIHPLCKSVRTAGYSVVGKGAALYTLDPDQGAITTTGIAQRDAAVASGQNSAAATAAITALEARFRFQASDGRWFTLAEPVPETAMFGALGDGNYVKENAAITGTDDWLAIQSCLDYVSYYLKGGKAILSRGMHKISKPLHVGYGDTFRSLQFEGLGVITAGDAGRGASGIVPTFTNQPVINIQAARKAYVSKIFIGGPLTKHILDNKLAYDQQPLLDDTVRANWDSAALGIIDKRYAPFSGVAVDAYSYDLGGAGIPADGYPDPGRPAYVPGSHLGAYAPQLRNLSSDITISDMEIAGFTVGICLNPSNDARQGDFLRLERNSIHNCKFIFSFGNHQARCTTFDNCSFQLYHTAYTNKTHGNQTGQAVGTWLNTAFGAGIDLIDVELAYGGNITMINCYSEAQWRIGSVSTTGNNDSGLTCIDCAFTLTMWGKTGDTADNRGLPAAHIYDRSNPGNMSSLGAVRFKGGSLYVDNVFTSAGVAVHLDGTKIISSRTNDGGVTQDYVRHGMNATAGVVVNQMNPALFEQRIAHIGFNLDTGATSAKITNRREQPLGQGRNHCAGIWERTLAADLDQLSDVYIPRGRPGRVYGKNGFANYSWGTGALGRELTFEWTGANRSFHGTVYGFGPGGVLHDPTTGSVFFIRSAVEGGGKLTIIAVLQNNYKDDGAGGITRTSAIDLAAGNWHINHGRYYTLRTSQRATLTSASTVISNVQNGEGTTALADNIAVNDWLELDPQKVGAFSEGGQQITAFDNAAKTITVNGSSAFTQDRVRLDRFIRQLPANA